VCNLSLLSVAVVVDRAFPECGCRVTGDGGLLLLVLHQLLAFPSNT
jgi:hypothetical protein